MPKALGLALSGTSGSAQVEGRLDADEFGANAVGTIKPAHLRFAGRLTRLALGDGAPTELFSGTLEQSITNLSVLSDAAASDWKGRMSLSGTLLQGLGGAATFGVSATVDRTLSTLSPVSLTLTNLTSSAGNMAGTATPTSAGNVRLNLAWAEVGAVLDYDSAARMGAITKAGAVLATLSGPRINFIDGTSESLY